ncbi:tripartite tricarboxylate transporter permease [Pseudonocardia kunmingensis]|uniref:Putative tricarboxylic transport membrane protein n=1 Tax=Pseudonocardia kunmingensis TaxID=630975 RepID=A0A543D0C8_9PSEU|nr:tripartite tricarboxylate transporter permease [Pseudonocardia kunmingensis]TQM02804.1 putative tricarboxylic transport membrane protein [Pseudonocardia kunmingensis]
MDALGSLLEGFDVVFQPQNLLFVVLGVVIGTVIGVLPGLGPTATIALLLPITFGMRPESAIIMLAGVYYGSMYGGTITSVLLRIPGEAATAVTAIDGYEMTRQGRSGPALGIAAFGSFIGGTVAVLGLVFVAPQLAAVAVRFGPPEFAALTVLGLVLVTYLGTRSTYKSVLAALLGLLLATVGQDTISGTSRFTFDNPDLFSGLDLVAIAMGVFGVGEILHALEDRNRQGGRIGAVGRILPTRADWARSRGPIARGTLLGFPIGMLPGGGGVMSSLTSYAVEKKVATRPEEFGRGAIEGVAGPETANNASSISAFIPLLTLGLPSNAVLALILGALMIQDVTPGPSMITDHPEVFWGVVASMVIGNIILLVLNVPLVGLFVQLLRVRMGVIGAMALLISMIGVYTVNGSTFDMMVMLGAGVLGYLMRKTGFEAAPLVLAFVLGAILETAFRQSMLTSGGDVSIFVTRPFSGALVACTVLVLVGTVVGAVLRRRRGDSTGVLTRTKQMAED